MANDGHRHAVDLAQGVGLEHRVAKIIGLDVLGNKVNRAGKVFLNNLFNALHAIGEFPVAGHHIHAQELGGIDHVLRVGPQGRGRALPGVAPIEQQRARATAFELLDQGGQVGEAADLAVAARRVGKVDVRERMGLRRTGSDTRCLEQVFPHQVRKLPLHGPYAHVHTGFPKVNGHELRMAIGHVQQRHVAKRRQVVQALLRRCGVGVRKAVQLQTGH